MRTLSMPAHHAIGRMVVTGRGSVHEHEQTLDLEYDSGHTRVSGLDQGQLHVSMEWVTRHSSFPFSRLRRSNYLFALVNFVPNFSL